MNSVDHGFSVCRVCISRPDGIDLKPMFADGDEIARKFIVISGVDISYDFERRNEVLICSKCLDELLKAYELREKIEQYDELYFETRRLVEKIPPAEEKDKDETGSKTVSAREELLVNVKDAGNKQPSLRGSKIVCEEPGCLSTLSSPQHLIRHKKTVHQNIKPYSCQVCQKTFSYKWNLKTHARIHDKNVSDTTEFQRFKCDECEGILSSKEALVSHVLEEHGKHLSKTEIVSCPICHRICKNIQGMKIHKSRLHDNGRYKNLSSNDAKFECEVCNRMLSSRQSLHQHLETRHKSLKAKQFNCDICSLKFVAKASLKSHIVNQHPWKDDE